MTNEEIVEGVRKHAQENYATGGWDYIVECYEDEDILEIAEGASSVGEAIKKVAEVCGIQEERRFEAQALSGELEHYGIVEHEGKLVRKAELERKNS